MKFENIIVSRGKSSGNSKYRLSARAAEVQCKLPQQAFDVLLAMSDEPRSTLEIADAANIVTRQSKERIVKYYVPMLLEAQLIEKV